MAQTLWQRARQLIPGLPPDLIRVFVTAWAQNGGTQAAIQIALAEMRKHPLYDKHYAGNKRADGTIRLTEVQYYTEQLRYRQILRDFNLPGKNKFFTDGFVRLLEGEKSVDQFLEDLNRLYVGIATNSDSVRQYFMEHFGVNGNVSNAALLASALDPSKSPLVYENEIRQSQIGGAALAHEFDLDIAEAALLASYGLEGQAANTLFSRAQSQVPTLSELVARHNDPDDEFTLKDYTDALVIGDATQLRRISRLISAESSLYRQGGGFIQDNEGRYLSLLDR